MKKLIVLIVVFACFIPALVWSSGAMTVPPYLVYQSQLYDDGGNPIADGDVDVEFRISDARGVVLYEESQTVEVVRGGISALVGGGADADGIPVGGLSQDVLEPDGPKYIEAQVVGMAATEPMEIASVPYAIYAGQSMGVTEGAVDSVALADGSIEFSDLSDRLVERLGEELSKEGASGGLVSQGYLESHSGAASIGVSSSFSYSGANNLQGVLSDFDRAIKMRDESANSAIEAEAVARSAADDAEATARAAADNAEATARSAADSANAGRIAALEGMVGSITAPPERPEYKVRAWGSNVYYDATSATIAAGGNAMVAMATGGCRINFTQPMLSANYAVNITRNGYSSVGPHDGLFSVSGKNANGFEVHYQESGASVTSIAFDFTVVGP